MRIKTRFQGKARVPIDLDAHAKIKRFAQVAYSPDMTFPAFVEMLAQYLPANDEAMSADKGRRAIIKAIGLPEGWALTRKEKA